MILANHGKFLSWFVAADETQIYYPDPETKKIIIDTGKIKRIQVRWRGYDFTFLDWPQDHHIQLPKQESLYKPLLLRMGDKNIVLSHQEEKTGKAGN